MTCCFFKIYSYSFGSISEISITNVDCTNDDYQVIFQCDVIYTGTCSLCMAVTVNCGKDYRNKQMNMNQLMNGYRYHTYGLLQISFCINHLTGMTRVWDDPYSGHIRLQGGNYTSEGLVEIYCNNEFGTICDDNFDQNAADTVCRQLGYTSAADYNNLNM